MGDGKDVKGAFSCTPYLAADVDKQKCREKKEKKKSILKFKCLFTLSDG